MEAHLLHSSPDQSISPYRNIRNGKKNNRSRISKPFENIPPSSFLPSNIHGGGILHAPPPYLSYSFPPSVSISYSKQSQQPPLLPLPISKPQSKSRGRGDHSSSPIHKKVHSRTKDQKKSNQSDVSPKSAETKVEVKSTSIIVGSTERLGPDPKDLPKDVSRVFSSSPPSSSPISSATMEKFSGSLFALSPPPSSLPLPTFSLRPKLSCKAEVSVIDTGATDNLRRLLRLR